LESGCATFRGGVAHREPEKNEKNTPKKCDSNINLLMETQPDNLTPSAERSTALESGCATFRGGAAHRELEKTKKLQNTSKK